MNETIYRSQRNTRLMDFRLSLLYNILYKSSLIIPVLNIIPHTAGTWLESYRCDNAHERKSPQDTSYNIAHCGYIHYHHTLLPQLMRSTNKLTMSPGNDKKWRMLDRKPNTAYQNWPFRMKRDQIHSDGKGTVTRCYTMQLAMNVAKKFASCNTP